MEKRKRYLLWIFGILFLCLYLFRVGYVRVTKGLRSEKYEAGQEFSSAGFQISVDEAEEMSLEDFCGQYAEFIENAGGIVSDYADSFAGEEARVYLVPVTVSCTGSEAYFPLEKSMLHSEYWNCSLSPLVNVMNQIQKVEAGKPMQTGEERKYTLCYLVPAMWFTEKQWENLSEEDLYVTFLLENRVKKTTRVQ